MLENSSTNSQKSSACTFGIRVLAFWPSWALETQDYTLPFPTWSLLPSASRGNTCRGGIVSIFYSLERGWLKEVAYSSAQCWPFSYVFAWALFTLTAENYGWFLLYSAYCQMIASYVLCWVCGSVLSWKYNSNWYDSHGHIIYNLNHASIKSKLGGWHHHALSVLTFNPIEDTGQSLFTKRYLINNKQSRERRHTAGNTSIDLGSPTKPT